jgi:glycosyltransferase involved in cell wall biosynthesis
VSYFHWITGWALGLIWLWRFADAALGMPQVADISRPEWDRHPRTSSLVTIIVPARNEETDIEQTLTHLLQMDYGNFEVIAVNDRSTDSTGAILDRLVGSDEAHRRLRVIHIDELPCAWLGKTHAMWMAARQARGHWLLFTDADVLFKPDSLRRALAYAECAAADHVVLFPRMIMKKGGEKMMIALFQMLFVFGHRPWKVADPKAQDHMGVGAFNLVRRDVYEKVGTYERLRMEVLDDMKLGKVVKNAGFAQRNVFGADLISIRWAKGASGIVNNLTKNLFAVMSFQWPRAIAFCFALTLLNLPPFFGAIVAHGLVRSGYLIALVSIFLIYLGISRKSDIPPYYFLLHPVSTCLLVYTMLRSTLLTLGQGGVIWRETFYPLQELRKGLV